MKKNIFNQFFSCHFIISSCAGILGLLLLFIFFPSFSPCFNNFPVCESLSPFPDYKGLRFLLQEVSLCSPSASNGFYLPIISVQEQNKTWLGNTWKECMFIYKTWCQIPLLKNDFFILHSLQQFSFTFKQLDLRTFYKVSSYQVLKYNLLCHISHFSLQQIVDVNKEGMSSSFVSY